MLIKWRMKKKKKKKKKKGFLGTLLENEKNVKFTMWKKAKSDFYKAENSGP